MIDSVERVERELTLLVCRAQKVYLQSATGPQPLDRSAYRVLGHVHDQGPLRLTDLAAAFALDLSTVSRQVATLQSAGWIRRYRDPSDQRAFLLASTPAGRDALGRTRAVRRRVLHDLLAGWPSVDVDVLAALLERFNTELRNHPAIDPARPEQPGDRPAVPAERVAGGGRPAPDPEARRP